MHSSLGFLQGLASEKKGISNSQQGAFEIGVQGQVATNGFLVIDMSHYSKIFARSFSTETLVERAKYLQINLGYKRYFAKTFSAGLSFATLYRLSDSELVFRSQNLDPNSMTSARDENEYGLTAFLAHRLFESDKFACEFEIKYFKAFTQKTSENADHYQFNLQFIFPWKI